MTLTMTPTSTASPANTRVLHWVSLDGCSKAFVSRTHLRSRFANASNWVDKTYNRQPNPKDVQAAVNSALKIRVQYGETIGKKSVKAEIELQGSGLTDKQKSSLLNKLWGTFAFSAEVNHESRFVDLNNDTMAMLLDKIREEDEWIKDYWDNDDEITIAVNAKSFEARVGSILASAAIAMEQEKLRTSCSLSPSPKGRDPGSEANQVLHDAPRIA